jgi:formylglycine-generating enzyme required for sulfatase activity
MDLIYIPPGEFMMGFPDSDEYRESKNGPQHHVRISKGFYMSATEVTQAQWKVVMGSNPSHFKGENLPVENVSWNDAVAFCKKLSQRGGKTYRLPTEAEWEYTCWAGSTTIFPYGESETLLRDYAWCYPYSDNETHPVGHKKPDTFGLYDMHGNVQEWCNDWYSENYYSKSPSNDPKGPSTGTFRVMRGGSWMDYPVHCRSATRSDHWPDFKGSFLGFRVVRD